MSKLIYTIPKANLKQTLAIALEVHSQCNIQPDAIEYGETTIKFAYREALQLVSGAITEGNYIKTAGYVQ